MQHRLNTRPERIFISVDQSTRRSTISFAPSDAGKPISHDEDIKGDLAMRDAKEITQQYPTCTIHGPHFHAARPPGRKRAFRKPASQESGGDE